MPFITRYRQNATGGLDEVQIREIQAIFTDFVALQQRRHTVMTSISKQHKLTNELKNRLLQATNLKEIEDLYYPFRPQRCTLADQARADGKKGL